MGSEGTDLNLIQKYRNKTCDDSASVSAVSIPPRNETLLYQSITHTQQREPYITHLLQLGNTLVHRDEAIPHLQQLNNDQSNKINQLERRLNENQGTEVCLSNRLRKLEMELGRATNTIQEQRSIIRELKIGLGSKKESGGNNNQTLHQLDEKNAEIRVLKSELVQKCLETRELEKCLKTVTEQCEKYKNELEFVVDNMNADKKSLLCKFEDFKKCTIAIFENYEIEKDHLLGVLEQQDRTNSKIYQ